MKRSYIVAIAVVILAAGFATVMFNVVNQTPRAGDGDVKSEVMDDTTSAVPAGSDPAPAPAP